MPKVSSRVAKLRVISGDFKGRLLASPRSVITHPMGAREKNALFNMIDVRDKEVLDVYAGSGALGIEALSRDAKKVSFVESNRQALLAIKQNLASLNLAGSQDRVRVFAGKVANFVDNYNDSSLFDIIIADPPYDEVDLDEIKGLVSLLHDDGTLVLSSPANQGIPEINGMTALSSHTYAGARITVFRRVSA